MADYQIRQTGTEFQALLDSIYGLGLRLGGVLTPGATIATPLVDTFWFAPAGTYTYGESQTYTVNTGYLGIIQYMTGSEAWSAQQVLIGTDAAALAACQAAVAELSENLQDVEDNFPEIAINLNNADLVIADTHGNKLASFYDGEFKTKMFDTANTPKQDDASADLDISDENDNVIVRFKNGHIRTKYFDSANIGYKNLEGIKFSILGDSISTFQGYIPTGYAYFYPAGNLTNVADTWWQKMAQKTKLTLLKNCSWSGSDMCGDSTSTTNAQAGCSTKRISDLADNGINPDIVIVYIGINDFYHAGNITLGTWTPKNEIPSEGIINHFSEAYALCIHKIMIAYPDAEIYCCSLLECKTADTDNRYPVINTNGEYLLDFNNRIKEIAEGLGVYFIDVHSCGINYWNGYGDTLVDTTHPNVKGAGLVSRCISNAILTLTKKYQ